MEGWTVRVHWRTRIRPEFTQSTTSDMKRMAWSEALAVSVVLRVQVNQLGWVYPRPSRLVM